MDYRKVQEAIEFLDEEIPKSDARIALLQYGGGPDESKVIANEHGFLRFGIEFLKAAFAPTASGGKSSSVDVDLDYLLSSKSSIRFDWFERREPSEALPEDSGSRLISIVLLGGIVVGTALALVGLVSVIKWLAG